MRVRIHCFLSILILPALMAGGEVNRSWERLIQSVHPGTTVVVTRMNATNVEGKLLDISSDSITVRWHGQPQVIQREDAYRVRKANIRRRHTLLGMAIGAGAGAAIFGASARSSDVPAAIALGGGVFGTGVGALTGGVLPIGAPLYEAERPLRKAAKAALR